MRKVLGKIILILAFGLGVTPVWAKAQSEGVEVVTSIPPLAGLVLPLLGHQDQLKIVLDSGSSPHGFQLRPSDMRDLQQADLMIMVGTGIDAWMQRSASRASGMQIRLFDGEQTGWLVKRQGGAWDHHHSHHHDKHHHGELQKLARLDGHIWLDVERASAWVSEISLALQQLRPERAADFQAREEEVVASLIAAQQVWAQQLQPFVTQPFVVMHDAYQYFEYHFKLNAVGSIYMNPDVAPSVRRIQDIRALLVSQKVVCVYQEPQFPADRLRSILRGMDVGVGVLDPLGADGHLVPYEQFYDGLVQSFIRCMQDGTHQ